MTRLVLIALLVAPAIAAADGNASDGKAKALACQACHSGSHAIGPRLAGQRAKYLVTQLGAFKKGDRKSDAMAAIASQLDDKDIANLAAYWSGLPAGDDADTPAATAIQKSPMTFPAGFPSGFTVYRTETDAATKTTSKSYANAAAITAAKANKPLPAGSAIVVVTQEGDKPPSYSAMEIRSGWGKPIPPLLANGDWAYNLFDAQMKPRADLNQAFCLACHKPAAASSYVFKLDLLRAAGK